MPHLLRPLLAALTALAASLLFASAHAAAPAEIGVALMHGKGGSPNKFVPELAQALEQAGFKVANLEMPWSGRRQYDVRIQDAENEISAAFDKLRANGARKIFIVGHSQGGLFALLYGGQHRVDGVVAIAPGGNVDAPSLVSALGEYVERARGMVRDGRGDERALFADFESSRGTNSINTTATLYLNWFDPNGPHSLAKAVRKMAWGVPVLYVAPTRDYPGLAKIKLDSFNALPSHPLTRLYEPESSHMDAPSAARGEIIRWMGEVASSKP